MSIGEFTLPKRVFFGTLALIGLVGIITVAVPTEWAFLIVIVYAASTAVAWMYIYYRARNDDGFKEGVEGVLDSEWMDARLKSAQRILPGGILLIMLTIQTIIANEALPESDVEALTTLLTIGPVTIGAFQAVLYMISAWMLGPVLEYLTRRGISAIRGGERA